MLGDEFNQLDVTGEEIEAQRGEVLCLSHRATK